MAFYLGTRQKLQQREPQTSAARYRTSDDGGAGLGLRDALLLRRVERVQLIARGVVLADARVQRVREALRGQLARARVGRVGAVLLLGRLQVAHHHDGPGDREGDAAQHHREANAEEARILGAELARGVHLLHRQVLQGRQLRVRGQRHERGRRGGHHPVDAASRRRDERLRAAEEHHARGGRGEQDRLALRHHCCGLRQASDGWNNCV
mmetsp:Transcript_40290/g.119387  ORF Transcript_40290/g.119387 Transcript_40290/m.119387 type:complete len:209 (-) Transcript_40290:9-635(-)